MMVMTARSDDCRATRQQRWQCCYLQLPRIALMLRSDEREASSHIENKNEMTEHTDTLKILIIQLLLEYNSAVIRIILVCKINCI